MTDSALTCNKEKQALAYIRGRLQTLVGHARRANRKIVSCKRRSDYSTRPYHVAERAEHLAAARELSALRKILEVTD